jgi:hypothetical protein
MRNAYTVLIGGWAEVKRLFGRPRHRWEVDIKMDPKNIGGWV